MFSQNDTNLPNKSTLQVGQIRHDVLLTHCFILWICLSSQSVRQAMYKNKTYVMWKGGDASCCQCWCQASSCNFWKLYYKWSFLYCTHFMALLQGFPVDWDVQEPVRMLGIILYKISTTKKTIALGIRGWNARDRSFDINVGLLGMLRDCSA